MARVEKVLLQPRPGRSGHFSPTPRTQALIPRTSELIEVDKRMCWRSPPNGTGRQFSTLTMALARSFGDVFRFKFAMKTSSVRGYVPKCFRVRQTSLVGQRISSLYDQRTQIVSLNNHKPLTEALV